MYRFVYCGLTLYTRKCSHTTYLRNVRVDDYLVTTEDKQPFSILAMAYFF